MSILTKSLRSRVAERPGRWSHHHRLPRIERLESRWVLASLSGEVFEDTNADGILDVSEQPLSQWSVYLDLDRDGRRDANEPHELTDSQGEYTFQDVAPGTYDVRVELLEGWDQAYPYVPRMVDNELIPVPDRNDLPDRYEFSRQRRWNGHCPGWQCNLTDATGSVDD